MKPTKYDLDEFIDLAARVEAQGGELLSHEHDIRTATIPDSRGNEREVSLTYCDEVALFEIPYRSSVDESERTVKVCAVDDGVGFWPRFQ